ncbi:hypothetical protein F4781DRAFT_416511 [Annulohypoxylon bovei var. microspora]|nr:hypothetical protein F4781DRAFT_416511 [Annulohypoxylon bovei var. microspora]
MISFHSSCLRSRHDVLLRTRVLPSPINLVSRASTLTAIHRGLRNSEKSRPQGYKKSSLRPDGSRNPSSNRSDFKITKGKKDISDLTPKPKSRQARFYDENESFGKKSMVYQLRPGAAEREKWPSGGKGSSGGKGDRMTPAQFMKDFQSGSERSSGRASFSSARGGRITRGSSRPRQSEGRERPSSSSYSPRSPDTPNTFGRRDSAKSTFDSKFKKPFNKSFERRDSTESMFDKKFEKPFDKSFEGRDSARSMPSRNSDKPFNRSSEKKDTERPMFDRNFDKSFESRDSTRSTSGRQFDKPFDRSSEKDTSRPNFDKKFDKSFESRDSARSTPHRKFDRFAGKSFERDTSRPNFDRNSDKSFESRDSARSTPHRKFDRFAGKPFDRRDSSRTESAARPTRNEWASREDQGKKREERYSQPPRDRQTDEEDDISLVRQVGLKDHDKGPVRIPRTTAASQFLYGYSVVEAALRSTTRQLYKLYLYCGENRQEDSRFISLGRQAGRANIPVTEVMDADGLRRMDKMSEGRPHNGFVLEASPLPQLPVKSLGPFTEESTTGFDVTLAHQSIEEAQINGTDDFIKCVLPPNRKPFILLLDRVQDPGNLGSILRSAAFLGVNAVGITKGYSATLNSIATKASAGASEVIKIFAVDSILDFLTRSKEADWAVYAAVAPNGRHKGGKHLTLDRIDLYDPLSTSPTILVVGNESEGLGKDTRRLADFEVSIPNQSRFPLVDSLNVGVATGILCSAFLKNQHGGQFDKILEPKENESGSESELELW